LQPYDVTAVGAVGRDLAVRLEKVPAAGGTARAALAVALTRGEGYEGAGRRATAAAEAVAVLGARP
jgi:hypothetical protein